MGGTSTLEKNSKRYTPSLDLIKDFIRGISKWRRFSFLKKILTLPICTIVFIGTVLVFLVLGFFDLLFYLYDYVFKEE